MYQLTPILQNNKNALVVVVASTCTYPQLDSGTHSPLIKQFLNYFHITSDSCEVDCLTEMQK